MQKHVVKRQTIELAVSDQLGQDQIRVQQLQSEVSRIYRQRIIPLLDEIFSELSSPEQIHRIERLEIDVGQITPNNLEQSLVTRVRTELRQALGQEISQSAPDGQAQTQTESYVEVLTFFLRTGSLPWWATANQPDILNNALKFLLDQMPNPLSRLGQRILGSEAHLYRLIYTFTDELLAQLAVQLATSTSSSAVSERVRQASAAELADFVTLLTQTNLQPAAILRQTIWRIILPLAQQRVAQPDGSTAFYQSILQQLAPQLGMAYADLAITIQDTAQKTANTPHTLASKLGSPQVQQASQTTDHPDHIASADIIAALHRLLPGLSTDQQEAIFNVLLAQNAPPQTDLANLTSLLHPMFIQLSDSDTRLLLSQLDELATLTKTENLQDTEFEQTLETLQRIRSTIPESTPQPQIQITEQPHQPDEPDLTFSEADEVYIHNAGLVILWPFLTQFFENLDLVADRRFKDEATQQRAVAILQHLVYPAETFPEYLLPLNKVLCGLNLTDIVVLESPLTETEIAQCNPFLEAIIAQAPILRNMSTDALRGTFLLREGVLSSRDGAWLLRAERETFDVVLDQFPWGWSWIKLPWMETPLRVEW